VERPFLGHERLRAGHQRTAGLERERCILPHVRADQPVAAGRALDPRVFLLEDHMRLPLLVAHDDILVAQADQLPVRVLQRRLRKRRSTRLPGRDALELLDDERGLIARAFHSRPTRDPALDTREHLSTGLRPLLRVGPLQRSVVALVRDCKTLARQAFLEPPRVGHVGVHPAQPEPRLDCREGGHARKLVFVSRLDRLAFDAEYAQRLALLGLEEARPFASSAKDERLLFRETPPADVVERVRLGLVLIHRAEEVGVIRKQVERMSDARSPRTGWCLRTLQAAPRGQEKAGVSKHLARAGGHLGP
jgi:hypothetical protein